MGIAFGGVLSLLGLFVRFLQFTAFLLFVLNTRVLTIAHIGIMEKKMEMTPSLKLVLPANPALSPPAPTDLQPEHVGSAHSLEDSLSRIDAGLGLRVKSLGAYDNIIKTTGEVLVEIMGIGTSNVNP